MIALALTLAALAAVADPGSETSAAAAIAAAVAVPGARAEVREVRRTAGATCPARHAEVLRPVTGSGEVPLRFAGAAPDGRACQAFGWASVRLTAPGLVAVRTIRAGEPLEGAVAPDTVELRAGRAAPLAAVPPGGRAARTLAAGTAILGDDVREGPRPGEPITVVVRIRGGLELSQDGRAVPCARGRACAVLPGGRRVEGRPEGGQLILEAP
ncbi:MAG TPA: hypothetical protein VEB43_05065 [Anaeromyxobacter sp.]|nr:hypothetical protein [Anaeromyxobacter sp.]